MGAHLFGRRSKPVRLALAGEVLQNRARRLLAESERMVALVREAANSAAPIIRAGLVDSLAATIGRDLVRGLRAHTEQLRFWSGIAPNLSHNLLDRALDIVISSD